MEYGERKGLDPSMIQVLASVVWHLEKSHNDHLRGEKETEARMNRPSPAKRASKRG